MLLAVIARELGPSELGVFVFGFAYFGIVLTPVGLGTNDLVLRTVARERLAASGVYRNALALKLAVGVPALAAGAAGLLAFGHADRIAVLALIGAGVLLDLVAQTFHAVFNAFERGDLLGATIVVQRVLTAALGVAPADGRGRPLRRRDRLRGRGGDRRRLATWLRRRHVPFPHAPIAPRQWPSIARRSLPFASQDVLTVLLSSSTPSCSPRWPRPPRSASTGRRTGCSRRRCSSPSRCTGRSRRCTPISAGTRSRASDGRSGAP